MSSSSQMQPSSIDYEIILTPPITYLNNFNNQ